MEEVHDEATTCFRGSGGALVKRHAYDVLSWT